MLDWLYEFLLSNHPTHVNDHRDDGVTKKIIAMCAYLWIMFGEEIGMMDM